MASRLRACRVVFHVQDAIQKCVVLINDSLRMGLNHLLPPMAFFRIPLPTPSFQFFFDGFCRPVNCQYRLSFRGFAGGGHLFFRVSVHRLLLRCLRLRRNLTSRCRIVNYRLTGFLGILEWRRDRFCYAPFFVGHAASVFVTFPSFAFVEAIALAASYNFCNLGGIGVFCGIFLLLVKRGFVGVEFLREIGVQARVMPLESVHQVIVGVAILRDLNVSLIFQRLGPIVKAHPTLFREDVQEPVLGKVLGDVPIVAESRARDSAPAADDRGNVGLWLGLGRCQLGRRLAGPIAAASLAESIRQLRHKSAFRLAAGFQVVMGLQFVKLFHAENREMVKQFLGRFRCLAAFQRGVDLRRCG